MNRFIRIRRFFRGRRSLLDHECESHFTASSSSSSFSSSSSASSIFGGGISSSFAAVAGGSTTAGTGGLNVTLGDEILELLGFCVINIVTARQILIRYDAYARTFEGTPMYNYYMKQVIKYPTSFRKVLHHEELNALADLYVEEMAHAKASMAMIVHFESQRCMFHDILVSTNNNNTPQLLHQNQPKK